MRFDDSDADLPASLFALVLLLAVLAFGLLFDGMSAL